MRFFIVFIWRNRFNVIEKTFGHDGTLRLEKLLGGWSILGLKVETFLNGLMKFFRIFGRNRCISASLHAFEEIVKGITKKRRLEGTDLIDDAAQRPDI